MKSLFKKSLLVLMVAFIAVFTLSFGTKVTAAEEVYKTLTFTSTTMQSSVSSYTSTWNTKCDGDTWKIANANNNKKGWNYIRMGRKSYASVATISTAFAIDKAVTKVVMTVDSVTTSSINSIKLTVATDSSFSNAIETVSATAKTGAVTFSIANPTPNAYYKITIDCKSASSNGIIQVSKVQYYADSSAEASPSIAIVGGSYTEVEDIISLTATLSNLTGDVVWTSSNPEIASVDQSGNVTAVSMGIATITAAVGEVKATHDFIVYPTDGSVLTVAEAVAVCKLSGETNSPYKYSLTAKITSIDDAYSEQYGNISVTVSDETGSIKVFRLTGGSELLTGDNITVTGYLVNYYGNTPEFAAGCTYVKQVNESIETIKTALNEIKAYMSLAYKYSVVEPVEGASQVVLAEHEVISFDLGANGTASHYDGNEISAGKTYTSGNYTLKVDNCSKVYDGARDAKGNSCLKFGTSSVVGTLQFTVPEEVTSIVIYVAKYKSNTTKVSINGTTYTLTQNSNDGKYDELTIDTSSNKTVKIATVSGGVRCMLNQIDYVIESQDPESPTIEYSSEFKIKCGVDASIKNIASLAEGKEFSWGIEVSDGMTEPRYYASNSEYMLNDDNSKMQYVIIDLGDVLNNIARAKKEFTVRAYVEIDGFKYYSSEAKTYSVASIVDVYCGFENLTEEQKGQVNSLNDVLTSLGC